MDCCICGNARWLAICQDCYEASAKIKSFISNVESDSGSEGHKIPIKSLGDMLVWMEKKKGEEEEVNERLRFMESSSLALRDGIHTDILVRPGDDGPPIAAHKALLATRSEILRTMLCSDECKAPVTGAISFPELTRPQLCSFLDFLYTGTLLHGHELTADDIYTLLLVADKYDIQFLCRFCERGILRSLKPANVLNVLEVSEACSSEVLKERAMGLIAKNVDEIVFSDFFESFAASNAHLCVQITRMLLKDRVLDR